MPSQPCILAIDQGGQSSRVAIYNLNGKQLHCISAPCETSHEMHGDVEYIEQNPREILEGVQFCLQQLVAVMGERIGDIIAAGFAGQGSSLLCWNSKTGEALSRVLSWQDIRGQNYLAKTALTHEQVQHITGLRISPHYGASKMRWCLENIPNVIAAERENSLAIGPIVSYLFWHLLGSSSVDPGHAQRTLLWNLSANQWDNHLLNFFKIPTSVLPECKFHNSHFGKLPLQQFNIPFTASARDQGASLFARGMPDQNTCYINIGTGAFIQRVSNQLSAPEGLLVSPLWLPQNQHNKNVYCWEATVNGAASAITFMQQQTGLEISPNEIQNALEITPQKVCYFLNSIGGLSAPYWRTDLNAQFSSQLTAKEKILAWIESIVFQIAVNIALMDSLGKAEKIIISGGMSRANGVCQRIADVTQIPVMRFENSDATLQGIACMAAGIPDSWQPSESKNLQSEVFYPNKNDAIVKRYECWQNAMNLWLRTST